MLTDKSRLPLRDILLIGLLPSPLKKLVYRIKGYRIGNGVSIGIGAVICGRNVTIGDHARVGFFSIVRGENIKIGAHVNIGATTFLDTPNIEIGDGTAVEEGVIIHAPPDHYNRIGKRVTLGHGAILHGNSVGDGAVIGMGAVLSIFSEIGAGAIVAEGSLVKWSQKIPDNVVAAGNPAAVKRDVRNQDREIWNWGKQLYVDLARRYLKSDLEPVDIDQCRAK